MMLFLLLEKSFQLDPPLNTQKDVAADSNTTDLLEVCSQGSPEGLPQGEPVQASSPSVLHSYSGASLEISTSEAAPAAEAARDVLCADQGLQGSSGSQATLPTLSPVFPVYPSSSLQSTPSRIPHRKQACSSGTASSPDVLKPGLAHASTKGGETVGAKRKLMGEDEQAAASPRHPAAASPSGQQHPPGTSKGKGRDTGKRSELMSQQGAKKSRKETLLQHRKVLEEDKEEEEEQASSARAGPSSRPEQCRVPEPVNIKQP